MDLGMLFLQSSEAPITDFHCYVVEIKRAWIFSIAWLDYMTHYRHIFNGDLPPSNSIGHCMGLFTLEPSVVGHARAAGIPVWLMQPESDFIDQNILRQGKILLIDQQLRYPPTFPSPILHLGKNGESRLYKNILKASQRFLCDDSADFISKPPPSEPYDMQPDIDVEMGPNEPQTIAPSTPSSHSIRASSSTVQNVTRSVDLADRTTRNQSHNAGPHPYKTVKERPALRWKTNDPVPQVKDIVDGRFFTIYASNVKLTRLFNSLRCVRSFQG
jgi:hypothetical protein